MSSTSADRSISSSISLPQWMKTKIGDRYDLEQAAFSPPSEDDSFFFIRYPLSGETKSIASKVDIDINAARHTEPSYLTEIPPALADTRMKRSSTVPDSSQFTSSALPPSHAEDSNGSSSRSAVASVAHNVLSGKIFGNYLSADNNLVAPGEASFVYHNRQRRNSKSLPASPLSSPKINRKNPYFTDPFANEPGKPGWILSILSQRKSIEDLTASAAADSSASENNSPRIPRHAQKISSSEPKPKPSELREMNFWSPVSM